jgi:hypothetical protein
MMALSKCVVPMPRNVSAGAFETALRRRETERRIGEFVLVALILRVKPGW